MMPYTKKLNLGLNDMQMSFWCKTKNLRMIQILVCRYDGRFVCNPNNFATGRSYVDLDWGNVSGKDINLFYTMNSIVEQPYF